MKSNLRKMIHTLTKSNETVFLSSSLTSTQSLHYFNNATNETNVSMNNETQSLPYYFNNATTETNASSSFLPSTNQNETQSLHYFNNTTNETKNESSSVSTSTNQYETQSLPYFNDTTNETNASSSSSQLTVSTNQNETQSLHYFNNATNETNVIRITNQTIPTNETKNGQEPESPSKETQCTLEAKLAYPYNDPDLASYKGYHASWLLVYRSTNHNETDYCDGEHHENISWCAYFNTGGPTIDTAYIGNVDDYYTDWAAEEDLLYDEIFKIEHSANSTFEMIVSHWFFETDYYTYYDEWTDHMFAPILTVKNKGLNASVLDNDDGRREWTHPVDVDVKTHIQNGDQYEKNPDYQGDFSIAITCTEACECIASNYTLL